MQRSDQAEIERVLRVPAAPPAAPVPVPKMRPDLDSLLQGVAEVLAELEEEAAAKAAALSARIDALAEAGSHAGDPRGAYDAQAAYRKGDHVALDGSLWIARRDQPGALPGDGWMLAAQRGQRGKQGERGAAGKDGVGVADIRGVGSALVFELSDGREVKIDIEPLVRRALSGGGTA